MRVGAHVILLVILISGAASGQAPALSQTAVLPKIDGQIHEEEWADAVTFTRFYVTIPKNSTQIPDSTIVYVKQSKDALYFAFKFWPKGRVIKQSLIRDRSTEEENEFFICLDLENKNQNGYIFIFSFLNNQRDFLVYNQRNLVQEWDWIWQNKSVVYEQARDGHPGYIETEVRIPVDKLQNKNRSQIGIDFQLFAYKPDGTSYFYSIVPESELLTVKHTYKMNIQPFEERINLNFNGIPYVVANKLSDSTLQTSVGGELNVSLDKHTLKGTFNTDESTLEADPFDFSLYRRPIFLQEKRPFFSKDLDIYRTPINIFYTRAIEDINWGLNYTYRSDHLKTGTVLLHEESPPGTGAAGRTFFASRPNFMSERINVGATVILDRNPAEDLDEKIVSVDGKLRLPSRFVFEPQVITNTHGQAYNAHLYYEYNGSGGPFADLLYRRFDRKFDAQTLFNNYGNDYDDILVGGGYNLPRNTTYFSAINLYSEYYRARTLSDRFTYQEYVSFSAYYKATKWLSVNHYFELNYPDETQPDGTFHRHRNFLTDHNAKFLYGANSLTVGYEVGPYFGSTLRNPYASLNLIFFGRLTYNLTALRLQYTTVDGRTDEGIYRLKMDYRIIDRLYLRSFLQREVHYGSDTAENLMLWNSLLQYEFFAGSNVYLVLNLTGEHFQNVSQYFKVGYEVNF